MIISATCDGSGVYIHHVEESETETVIASCELVLVPQSQPEIFFAVPIGPWQGNGS